MLGQAIRAARERVEMSQVELGRRIGVGAVTMWKYESGRLAVTSKRLRIIATVLNDRALELGRDPVTIDSLLPETKPARKGAA